MSKPVDAVTVVIPVHNAADRIDRVAGLAAIDGEEWAGRSRSSSSMTAAPTAAWPSSPVRPRIRVC